MDLIEKNSYVQNIIFMGMRRKTINLIPLGLIKESYLWIGRPK